MDNKEKNILIDKLVYRYLSEENRYQALFSSMLISRYGSVSFYNSHRAVAELGIEKIYIPGFNEADIAKLTFENRYLLDIPWKIPSYLTAEEREYQFTNPSNSKTAERIWANIGYGEIKKLAVDFKHYCTENNIYDTDSLSIFLKNG